MTVEEHRRVSIALGANLPTDKVLALATLLMVGVSIALGANLPTDAKTCSPRAAVSNVSIALGANLPTDIANGLWLIE